MMVGRLARKDENGDPAAISVVEFDGIDVTGTDANILLIMTIYAYFFIAMVQLIGIFGGDKSPLQVTCFTHLKDNEVNIQCFRILSLLFADSFSISPLVPKWQLTPMNILLAWNRLITKLPMVDLPQCVCLLQSCIW